MHFLHAQVLPIRCERVSQSCFTIDQHKYMLCAAVWDAAQKPTKMMKAEELVFKLLYFTALILICQFWVFTMKKKSSL